MCEGKVRLRSEARKILRISRGESTKSNPHPLVWASVINHAEGINKGNLVDGTAGLGVLISAARVPAVLRDNVDFAGNMAETKSSGRSDGDWVRPMIDTGEVIHLYV